MQFVHGKGNVLRTTAQSFKQTSCKIFVFLFRRFTYSRKATISFVIPVRPPALPSLRLFVSARLSQDEFSWNLISGLSWKSVERIQIWLKSDKKYRKVYVNTYVTFIVARRQIRHKSIVVKHFFYIVSSDMLLNNTQKINCFVCTAIMVTRTRQNLTLYTYIACLLVFVFWYAKVCCCEGHK